MTSLGNAQHLIVFAASSALALLMTPFLGRLAKLWGVIDYPSRRRFHLESTPLMGGIAVCLVFVIVLLCASKFHPSAKYFAVIAAAVFLTAVGLFDDIKSLSPRLKLATQFLAAALLFVFDLKVEMTGIAFLDFALTLIWVAGIVNCLNLLDNIDGLAGGTAAIAGCVFFVGAVLTGRIETAIVAAAFSGACMGFLFHNFHPASIFSGDAGSMFMGLVLAALGLSFMENGNGLSHLYPGVVLGLLIFDTGLVTIMRKTHGKKITDGGRDHTSHRLCYLGLSVQGSVIALFGVCAFFGAAATAMLLMPSGQAELIPIVLFSISIFFWFMLRNTYDYTEHNAR
ncbi:MAG TPA: MraY family glycosyltransferase [bacterium]|nr:MraY family glycosyltransferase [bacterium]